MIRTTFHEEAKAELLDAVCYYEDRVVGLGHALVDDVEQAVREISASPCACPTIGDELRRRILRKFPYSLLYVEEPGRIRILAVAHHKRRPGYWKDRLP